MDPGDRIESCDVKRSAGRAGGGALGTDDRVCPQVVVIRASSDFGAGGGNGVGSKYPAGASRHRVDRADPLASWVGKLGNGLGKQYSRSTTSRIAGALSAEGPAGPSSFVQGIHLRSCRIAGLSTWTKDRVARWALGEPCTSLSRRRM